MKLFAFWLWFKIDIEKTNETGTGEGDKQNEKDTNNNESVLRKAPEENKSEVQLIHEYAFFLKKSVEFKVKQEPYGNNANAMNIIIIIKK